MEAFQSLGALIGMNALVHRSAEDFPDLRRAEGGQRGGVEIGETQVGFDEDGHRGALDNTAEVLLALAQLDLGLTPLGDVGDDGIEQAAALHLDGTAVDLHVTDRAAGLAVLEMETIAVFGLGQDAFRR